MGPQNASLDRHRSLDTVCKLADQDMQICSQLRSLTYVDEDLRMINVLKRIVTNNCDEHLFVRNF